MLKKILVVICLFLFNPVSIFPAVNIKTLPEAEKALLNSTDPWGLAFSDQIIRFQTYFLHDNRTDFVLGIQNNLEKIFRNKYWFRGEVFNPENAGTAKPIWAVTGGTASFQVAVLPKTGAEELNYEIQLSSPVESEVYREEFVKLPGRDYPRVNSEYWPDPLIPENTATVSGTDLAVFLVELKIPADFDKTGFSCRITVKNTNGSKISCNVPVEVVKLQIAPKRYPLVAWFENKNLSDAQFRQMCFLALEHHLQPLTGNYLKKLWNYDKPQEFDDFFQFLLDNGQSVIEIPEPGESMYLHLKEKNWLKNCMVYSNADEPSAEMFMERNIPYAAKIRDKYKGLRIFLASEYHADMDRGCDIWLTDLSSSTYNPAEFKIPSNPELWHYYCHLPIRYQMRAPLTMAPNMLIDNAALEHRLALWMSWYYKAKGVLIWSGNNGWNVLAESFWQEMVIPDKTSNYPYAGIHNGNGFLVYPPREKAGKVLPSLRLKILRDGMEDIAIMEAVKRKYGARTASKLTSPVPEVFIHTHYYDSLPEKLLKKRESILKNLRRKLKQTNYISFIKVSFRTSALSKHFLT